MRNQTRIDKRPAIVDERSRIGDWEIDTIVGYQSSGYVVSMVERRSRLTVLGLDVICHENANGLVRQYSPKQSSFSKVTDDDCQEIMMALNTRPRKRLDWNTPAGVFSRHTGVAPLK